jgi:hypothetical protein
MSVARVIVWLCIVAGVAIDIVLAATGRQTISAAVRETDIELGTLLRWSILALWCHWFVTWGT